MDAKVKTFFQDFRNGIYSEIVVRNSFV